MMFVNSRRLTSSNTPFTFRRCLIAAATLPAATPAVTTTTTEKLDQVYMDVTIGKDAARRMSFTLFSDVVPKTTANFRSLCEGFKAKEGDKEIGYKGSGFHRLIKGFMLQGGDFTNHNGTGGKSIYGKSFADENFKKTHSKRGLLSMANSGPNTNGSQFFITFKPTPWLDKHHVVFGELTDGMEVLDQIENVKTNKHTDKPLQKLTIVDCGILKPQPEETNKQQSATETAQANAGAIKDAVTPSPVETAAVTPSTEAVTPSPVETAAAPVSGIPLSSDVPATVAVDVAHEESPAVPSEIVTEVVAQAVEVC